MVISVIVCIYWHISSFPTFSLLNTKAVLLLFFGNNIASLQCNGLAASIAAHLLVQLYAVSKADPLSVQAKTAY